MGPAGVGRSLNKKNKIKKRCKVFTNAKFAERHIDQVWEDVRKLAVEVHVPGKSGPQGTVNKSELDEDTPGMGKHFCIPCSRYFQTPEAMITHEATRPHKRKVKMLMSTARPHNELDSIKAAGMGAPDNGRKLRSSDTNMDMAS